MSSIATESHCPGNKATSRSATTVRLPTHRLKHGHIHLGGHAISTPVVLTVALEATLLALAAWLAPSLRFHEWPPVQFLATHMPPVAIGAFVLVTLVSLVSVGFYRLGMRQRIHEMLLQLLGAFLLSSIVLGFLFFLLPDLVLGRGILLIAYAQALPLLLASRLLIVPLIGHEAFAPRILVLGAGPQAASIDRYRDRARSPSFKIAGFVRWGEEQPEIAPAKTVALDGSLYDYACTNRIDEIVVAISEDPGSLPYTDLIHCKMGGIHVRDINGFFEREAMLVKLDTLRPNSFVFGRSCRQTFYGTVAKRMLDLATSLTLLVVTWPLMLATALGLLVESRGRGSVLYRQTRVGQHGRPFTLYKFRSMVMDAERDGVARWAVQNDPRVTPLGRFIRKTRLDELPQLINVLRGDMSFVGPRPERPEFVAGLAEQIPHYDWRHMVKPGVTGWAQINYPYASTVEDAANKLEYDLFYVKHQNIVLDVLTIIQTAEIILWGRGAR